MAEMDITLHSQNHELYKVRALIDGTIGMCDIDEKPHLARALNVVFDTINGINNALDGLDSGLAGDTSLRQQIYELYDVEGLLVCVNARCEKEHEINMSFLLEMAMEKVGDIAGNLQTLDFTGSMGHA